jgi:hypothetical protein
MDKILPPEKLILLTLVLISCYTAFISYTSGYMLAYNDATAHLNTARRVTDSLTPGLVQLGSVWLPLLHLLQLPFVTNFTLWQSGLAGWIVSGASFVITCLFVYKITLFATKQISAALLAVCVIVLNANMLYLQTTAMFEPLLLATASGAIYYLYRWTHENNINYLVLGAFYTFLATLTRYDGWALFVAATVYVGLMTIVRRLKFSEGPVLIFTFLAGFGILLWFAYNLMIFGDPLYFQSGEFSAKAQQDILESRDSLPTKHNLPLSINTYTAAIVLNLGIVSAIGLLLGVISYVVANIKHPKRYAPLLLVVPYPFNILSLYLGQSVIWTPFFPPFFDTYFNIRYGILMLPAAAFFVAYLSKFHVFIKLVLIPLLIAQMGLFFFPQYLPTYGQQVGIVTIKDTVSSVNQQTETASSFLNQQHQDGELILASSASMDAFIFRTGVSLKNFVTEGTGYYWYESLQDPTRHATWIVFFQDKSDRVGRVVGKRSSLEKEYQQVYSDQTYVIYKRF